MNNKDILQFDVAVDMTETYTLTRDEFNKINQEYDLGLDFDNLTDSDLYDLFANLGEEHITDTDYRDYTMLSHEYFNKG